MTRWKRLRSPAEVRSAVLAQVELGASVARVLAFAAESGWEHSDLVGEVVHSSTPARGRWPFVSAKWLVEFRFEDDRLVDVTVRKGLTGP